MVAAFVSHKAIHAGARQLTSVGAISEDPLASTRQSTANNWSYQNSLECFPGLSNLLPTQDDPYSQVPLTDFSRLHVVTE